MKPRSLAEVRDQPVTNEMRGNDTEGWDSWGVESGERESPVVDDSQILAALKQPGTPQTPRSTEPVPESTNAEPGPHTLAGRLSATPAPAVGVIGIDLALSSASLTVAIQAFACTGLYAAAGARGGRNEQRAVVITVDREPNGRFVATVERPGQPHLRPEECTPRGASPTAEALAWLQAVVLAAREAAQLPMLVVVAEGCFSVDRLEPLAQNASCLVAVVEHRPGVVQPVWEPRLLEPLPEPEQEPTPAPRRTAPKRSVKPGAMGWLESVSELVQGHPESIPGPNGERISVSYGRTSRDGRPYASLTGFSQRDTHSVPMEIEIVPGVLADLSDLRALI